MGWASGPRLPRSSQGRRRRGTERARASVSRAQQGAQPRAGTGGQAPHACRVGGALTSSLQQAGQPELPGLFMAPGRGWAGRLISPAQALPLSTGPGDVELKSSRISSVPGVDKQSGQTGGCGGCGARGQGIRRGSGGGCRPVPRAGVSCIILSSSWGMRAYHCPLCQLGQGSQGEDRREQETQAGQ